MTDLIAQQASHDYLRAASELVDAHAPEYAAICARAAQAEVDDPLTVVGEWCPCMVCQAVLVASQLRRHVG